MNTDFSIYHINRDRINSRVITREIGVIPGCKPPGISVGHITPVVGDPAERHRVWCNSQMRHSRIDRIELPDGKWDIVIVPLDPFDC